MALPAIRPSASCASYPSSALILLPAMPSSFFSCKLLLIPQDPAPVSPVPGEVHLAWEVQSDSARMLWQHAPGIWLSLQTGRGPLRTLLCTQNRAWHIVGSQSTFVEWMCSHQSEYMWFPEEINTFRFLSSLPCWFQCGRQTHLWILVSFFSSTLCADCTLFWSSPLLPMLTGLGLKRV